MAIQAKKIEVVYAEVDKDGLEFRVYPSGAVQVWNWYTDVDGEWVDFRDYEADFSEIQAAGLAAING